MSEINFVDTTFRDAHASLWGEKMSTAMMYQISETMDKAGFKAMDATAISHFEFAVRYFRENPWERMRLISKKIKKTPLSIMMLGNSLTPFKLIRGPVLDLWMKRCAENGIKRVHLMDPSNNMMDISESVKFAKDSGLYVVAGLIYSLSPIHTNDYYAQRAREVANLGVDAVYLKDSGGLLTPDRTRSLVPVIQDNIGEIPLEIHSHCTTGLAPLCYLEAIQLGVETVHTAISPLANGPSQPSTENIVANARGLGYSVGLDEKALRAIAAHFESVAKNEELPLGAPPEYDLYQYEHQIPGGVISNLKRQLSEMGQESRLEEVIEETITIRKELGYPIMVTPFSQFVVTQATLNVVLGERYKQIIDELIKFAMGCYGADAGRIDQNLMDKIMSSPMANELSTWEPPRPSIEELRQEYGPTNSDDELLLRVLCQGEDIVAMKKAGPINTDYSAANKPLAAFIRELGKHKKATFISIHKKEFSMTLQRRVSQS